MFGENYMKHLTTFQVANELINLGIIHNTEMPLIALQKYIFLADFSLFCKYNDRIISDGIAMGKFGPLYSTFINIAHVYQNRSITNIFYDYKKDKNGYVLKNSPIKPSIVEEDVKKLIEYIFLKFKNYSIEELNKMIDESPYLPSYYAKDNAMIYIKHFKEAKHAMETFIQENK